MAAEPVLVALALRLEADLRTRFPTIRVRFVKDEEGTWTCEVQQGDSVWGSIGAWVDADDDPSASQREGFLASIAFEVAENLWPDDETDPWPLCPCHRDDPLTPSVVRGRASWGCSRDASVAVPIGDLA